MDQLNRNITEVTESGAGQQQQQHQGKNKEQQFTELDSSNNSQSRGADSGFISGPQSGPISSQIDEPVVTDFKQQTYIPPPDSGLIEDVAPSDEEDDEGIDSKDCIDQDNEQDQNMLIDSGLVADVSESLSRLNIIDSSPFSNNLSKPKEERTKSMSPPTETPAIVVTDPSSAKQPWEIYYKQNDEGDTQLHLAIIHGLVDVVIALIRLAPHPCLLDIQNDNFQAPLHLAVITCQPVIVRKLLFAGAETSVRDRHGNSPLHLACSKGDLSCVKALTNPLTTDEISEIKQMASLYKSSCPSLPDLEQRNYDGELCVHIATLGNHTDILHHLMCSGADLNSREGKAGRTPLHLAIEEDRPTVATFLLEKCVDKLRLETLTYGGLTAYQLASLANNNEVIRVLSKRGAEPLSPPESDDDSDDYDDTVMDRFPANQSFFAFNGANAINVS